MLRPPLAGGSVAARVFLGLSPPFGLDCRFAPGFLAEALGAWLLPRA
jgi:hypothetical protein